LFFGDLHDVRAIARQFTQLSNHIIDVRWRWSKVNTEGMWLSTLGQEFATEALFARFFTV
jgi:hypothetical protein